MLYQMLNASRSALAVLPMTQSETPVSVPAVSAAKPPMDRTPTSVRVAYEFLSMGPLNKWRVRRWIDRCELEQADQCKRIFGKGLGEPCAVSKAGTAVRSASRGFTIAAPGDRPFSCVCTFHRRSKETGLD
jgi:hypothetical protein